MPNTSCEPVPQGIAWRVPMEPEGEAEDLNEAINPDIHQVVLFRAWGYYPPEVDDPAVVDIDARGAKTWAQLIQAINDAAFKYFGGHRGMLEDIDRPLALREFYDKPGMWWIMYEVPANYFDAV
jgi:hypothetical protein